MPPFARLQRLFPFLACDLDFEAGSGRVAGALPQGLPALYWSSWPGIETLGQLLLPILAITRVSFLETASSAKVDSERQGRRWHQDLIGQGLGKITAAAGFERAIVESPVALSRLALLPDDIAAAAI